MASMWNMVRVTLFGSRNDSPGGSGSFEPSRDIPSLAGRVIFVTGGAGDLGRQTIIDLARYGRPARIYIADLPRGVDAKKELLDRITREAHLDGGDSPPRDDDTQAPTEIRFLDLDLTSFESIRACAAEFIAQEARLDILVCNAGIIRVALGKTREGYEVHFGLNYLGHALLSRLLIPTMLRTAEQQPDTRIVIVSSEGHSMAPKSGIEFDRVKTECQGMSYSERYGQSKVALIGLARELAGRYPQLKIAAVHPGRILTGMASSLQKEDLFVRLSKPIAPLFCVPVATGVKNHLWAATSPSVVSGKYYEPVGIPDKESAVAKDEDLSRRLWEWTDGELEGALLSK